MSVRVDVFPNEDTFGTDVTLNGPGADRSAALEHETLLGAGVRLTLDLDRPAGWRRLSVRDWTESALPLINALAGERTTKEINALASRRPSTRQRLTSEAFTIAPVNAAPWLRVAAVHGLDRWLHLPLEQSLVHAEIGVARTRAAFSLPRHTDLRDTMIDDALGWVRQAAAGVTRILHSLARDPRPLPPTLRRSLTGLVDGYAELTALVGEPDSELSAVVDSWRPACLSAPLDGELASAAVGAARPSAVPDSGNDGVSMIDPRHVRARVLQLGDEPESPEIVLSPTRANGEDAVRVEVPAFDRQVDPDIARRLVARLVDRRSGDPHSYAALAVRPSTRTKSRPSLFECTLPLRGAPVEHLRAEVFDALFRSRQAARGSDDELVRVRTAVLSLRRARSLAASAALRETVGGKGPGRPLVAELLAAHQTQEA